MPKAGLEAAQRRSVGLGDMRTDEYGRVMEILNKHKDLNFVQRILKPGDWPRLELGPGNYATHLMASGEADGKHLVFPTVIYDQHTKSLKDMRDQAFDYAMRTGGFISFDTAEDADWFAKNYKTVWGSRK